jgi:hypothetical protein
MAVPRSQESPVLRIGALGTINSLKIKGKKDEFFDWNGGLVYC